MWRLTLVADSLEKNGAKVKRYQDLPTLIKFKGDWIFENITLWMNLMLNLFSCLANIRFIEKMMLQALNIDRMITKGVGFLLFLMLIFVIVEPEKIKFITVFVTFLLVGMGMIMINLAMTFFVDSSITLINRSEFDNIVMYNIEYLGLFLGVSSYSFESIGTLFNSMIFPNI